MQHQTEPSSEQLNTQALRKLLRVVLAGNAFYQPILEEAGLTDTDKITLDEFRQKIPLTTKQHLVDDQLAHGPYGRNLSFPLKDYTRFCQTSGTTGRPLRIIDTPASWQSMLEIWRQVFTQAGCKPGDRVLFAFSFGPFLGFWTAYDAAAQMGMMCLPAGGMSTSARLAMIQDNAVDTLCCTPTYALHLAETAQALGMDLSQNSVRRLIVAGEPGGSIPATRQRIENAWQARLYDHHGMTEVGPVSYQDNEHPGSLRIADDAFLVEVIDPVTTLPVVQGQAGELVLTTLNRHAWPLLRYRTGDLVQQSTDDPLRLVGGVLGRVDDMRLVRGVNVYPSAVDAVVRRYDEVAEYEVLLERAQAMTELTLRIEPTPSVSDVPLLCKRVAQSLRDALSLRVPVLSVGPGTLPRFEMKARRWREIEKP